MFGKSTKTEESNHFFISLEKLKVTCSFCRFVFIKGVLSILENRHSNAHISLEQLVLNYF